MISTMTPPPSGPKIPFSFGLNKSLVANIINMGWPVIVGMMTQTAINTMDLLMVGRLEDSVAVPGTSAILSSIILLWAFGGFLSAISVGTQALSARRFSEGKYKKAGQILSNSLLVAFLSTSAMLVFIYWALGPILGIMVKSESVRPIAETYTSVRFLGLYGMTLMASYKSFYDGLGRVRVHMVIAILMNIMNAGFDYLLIFGAQIGPFEIPALEVEGAAWGSVIASYLGLLIMIGWTLRKNDRIRYGYYKLANLSKPVAMAVAQLSLWSGLATLILMIGVGFFNYIVSLSDQMMGHGDLNSAGASVIIHVMMLIFMISLAFGTATATLVSQSIGQKAYDLAEQYTWQSVKIAVYVMGTFGLILAIFPEATLGFFLKDTAGDSTLKALVIENSTSTMRLAAGLLSPFSAAAMVLMQALYGAGQTRYVMVVEMVLHFLFLVPFAYLFGITLKMGLFGCFLAAICYAGALALMMGYQFNKGTWKETSL